MTYVTGSENTDMDPVQHDPLPDTEHTETGHHNVSRWKVRKSQESCTVSVSAPKINIMENN